MLNRILAHAGKSLATFIAPRLDMLGAQGQRKWCSVRFRWLRREHAVIERQEQCWIPEVLDECFLKDWDRLPLLLVTLDQASTGWGACHFCAQLGSLDIHCPATSPGDRPRLQTCHEDPPTAPNLEVVLRVSAVR